MTQFISALGLDVGRKRIGVAGCDRLGLMATGLTTIENRSFEGAVQALQALVSDRQVEILVVGMPYSKEGQVGYQGRRVRNFAQRLSQAIALPIEYVDERLTSFQAEQMLLAEGRSPSRHKALIDRKAAAIILQQWLDSRSARSSALLPHPDPLGDSQ
ncbi:MAG: Holliday junction resolvase RuvX [Leptolyngbyaceae cyanobacterium]